VIRNKLAFLAVLALPLSVEAQEIDPAGKFTGDFRVRYEHVDDEGRAHTGDGTSARLRLGYQTPLWNGLSGFAELETIQPLGGMQYDNGLNGKTDHGRISDVQLTDLNQLYVNYGPTQNSLVKLGRQSLAFDNSRFIARSGSRQNDPTHDAVLFQYGEIENLKLYYAHSRAFRRYSNDRSESGRYTGAVDMLNANYTFTDGLAASVYGYYLDFSGVQDERDLSSRTNGVRVTYLRPGEGWQPMVNAEFARQHDYGDSSKSYSENYSTIEGGIRKGDAIVTLTAERLGGNGDGAVSMPLGSSHNFLGYADKFSTTPEQGVRDIKLTVSVPYELPWEGQMLEWTGKLHYLTSDNGGIDYGREGDMYLVWKPVKNHAIGLKYADYRAKDFSDDTKKWLLSYEYKF
jgi:hypothetical protein